MALWIWSSVSKDDPQFIFWKRGIAINFRRRGLGPNPGNFPLMIYLLFPSPPLSFPGMNNVSMLFWLGCFVLGWVYLLFVLLTPQENWDVNFLQWQLRQAQLNSLLSRDCWVNSSRSFCAADAVEGQAIDSCLTADRWPVSRAAHTFSGVPH